MEKLSRKQEKALALIVKRSREQGYPPTLAELTEELGAASKNTAVKYLRILARKGYIVWDRNKARGIQVAAEFAGEESGVPLIGSIAAGTPMLAEANIERHVAVPRFLLHATGPHFLLRVAGESMINAGILPGDLVLVQARAQANVGDVVVALIGNEATVKRLAQRADRYFLHAENPAHADIYPEGEWSVQGKVVALIRETVV
ncbi:MAG TPA: transcriptional repressor LexA [bacterium]|nr:transcriptional repressor LexA [bacterium]HQI49294.1 transcriptional repressor LexA [bacterium]HQJ64809.1 transcriptional repressor LexA [bacterium]